MGSWVMLHLMLLCAPLVSATAATYKVGEKVKLLSSGGNWKGKWFPGKITKCNGDDTYVGEFDAALRTSEPVLISGLPDTHEHKAYNGKTGIVQNARTKKKDLIKVKIDEDNETIITLESEFAKYAIPPHFTSSTDATKNQILKKGDRRRVLSFRVPIEIRNPLIARFIRESIRCQQS